MSNQIGRSINMNPVSELHRLRAPSKAAPKSLEIVDSKQVEKIIQPSKSFKNPNFLLTEVPEQKLTSGKMNIIDQVLEKVDVETMNTNAAKLSKPSTWGKTLLNIGLTGLKKSASLIAQTGITIGQYVSHLGGLTVNLGLLVAHKCSINGVNKDLKSVTTQINTLDQQFSHLEQTLEQKFLIELGSQSSGSEPRLFTQKQAETLASAKRLVARLKLAPLDNNLIEAFKQSLINQRTSALELKSQQDPNFNLQEAKLALANQVNQLAQSLKSEPIFSGDKSELQTVAKKLGGKSSQTAATYYNLKDVQGRLQNEKASLQGNHRLNQARVHASIKNFSWSASRKIDEALGLREKSIKADHTWDYMNMPDLAESMVGNISNARSLASVGLKTGGLGDSVSGGILTEASGPLLIVGETVGLASDVYGGVTIGLRLNKLAKFENKIKAGQSTLDPLRQNQMDGLNEHPFQKATTRDLGENTKDALTLLRKNTKQTLTGRIVSGLKHASVLGTVGTLVGVGLLTLGTIVTGGTLLIALGVGAGVAYGGLTMQKAYKQHMRIENIKKLETAHANVQNKIDILQATLQSHEMGSSTHSDITLALNKFQNIKGTIESTLRQTSAQHAAMGVLADLMSQEPDGQPTPRAKVAHRAILEAGFEVPDGLKAVMQTRDTKGIQNHLSAKVGGDQHISELRLTLVQSLEQYKT